jgi:hypothetical protein
MPVASAVAQGDLDVGIHQNRRTDAYPRASTSPDIARRPQQDHRLRAGAHNYGQQPDAAMELVKCLALPSSVPVIKNNGMDPA